MVVVLAVSGGVDSVVMLDMVVRRKFFGDRKIIVAHFDHGVRSDSSLDSDFVRSLASSYDLEFVSGSAKLGADASEEIARKARYDFLNGIDGEIWTAHHFGDCLETVAINLIRGTGWRGLAVFGNRNIGRFFIDFCSELDGLWGKKEVLKYAQENNLEWREDSTNLEEKYLRNKVRWVLDLDENYEEMKNEIGELFLKQRKLTQEIDEIVSGILPENGEFLKEDLLKLPDEVLAEVLRAILIKSGHSQTRNGVDKLVFALKTYENGKKVNLEGDFLVKIGKSIRI